MNPVPVRGVAHVQTPARVLDLSRKGALMALTTPLQVGAVHDFLLDLAGDRIWVQGEVRRCQLAEGGGDFEVGIEFVGIDPRDEKRVADYLSRRSHA
ncbi:MAG TPA: PilZ domain-containing protein [Vicinamibacteria bacterium]|jgi:hypothetical protein|nr:PilZ domain-containing protein [Vicinamibacteria bacterium]